MAELSSEGADIAANAVCQALDGGRLVLLDDMGNRLAIVLLPSPAFGPASEGIAQSVAPKIIEAREDGIISSFVAVTPPGREIWSGSVGTQDADLILDRTDVRRGSRIEIQSIIYEQRRI